MVKRIASEAFGIESYDIERLEVWSRPNPEPLLVNLQITSDDGRSEMLPHIELKRVQAGELEVTFSNVDQTHPFLVLLRTDLVSRRHHLAVQPKSWPISALTLDSLIRLGKCISVPGRWKIIRVDTGERISSGRNNPSGDHLEFLKFAEFAEDMAEIQRKLEIPILIPQGEFSEEDQEAIAFLRLMLHGDKDGKAWSMLALALSREGTRLALHDYEKEPMNAWAVQADVTVKLFGTEIPVGQVRQIYPSVILENEAEIRSKLTNGEVEEIELRFVPREDRRMRYEFVDWDSKKW